MDFWKILYVYISLTIFLLLSIIASLAFGSVDIPLPDIWNALRNGLLYGEQFLPEVMQPVFDIIWLLRLPRIILAVIIGSGLAVCGVIMQAIVKNPLADPYILGISSGASLGATAAIMLGAGSLLGDNFIGAAAFIGAFSVSAAVLIIANMGGRSNSVKLLLGGMALSAVCSAFSSFIVYYANNMEGMQTVVYWLMGSLAGANWNILSALVPINVVIIIFFCSQYRILNLMLVGDATAVTLGCNLHWYRQGYLLLSSLVVGFSVYAAGMIGFIGLIVPHAVRILIGTDHKYLVPISAFCGAAFLLWADVLCRIIVPGTELPIGILISLIGAPFFVYLMIKKTYGFGSN